MKAKFVKCPHCDIIIEVLELNCKIFRCGIFKDSLTQINPHLHKIECDRLITEDLIYGCGKPFRVDIDSQGEYISSICDYI
jgi:hypothetical protein